MREEEVTRAEGIKDGLLEDGISVKNPYKEYKTTNEATPRDKAFVALISQSGKSEIVNARSGIAFSIAELEFREWDVIYVATSYSDAEVAIEHYKDYKAITGFTNPNRYR